MLPSVGCGTMQTIAPPPVAKSVIETGLSFVVNFRFLMKPCAQSAMKYVFRYWVGKLLALYQVPPMAQFPWNCVPLTGEPATPMLVAMA